MANKTVKTLEFVGDVSSVTKASKKMVADLEAAATQIQRLNLGSGFDDLPANARAATDKTISQLNRLKELQLAKKTLTVDADISKAEADLKRLAGLSDDNVTGIGKFKSGFQGAMQSITSQLGPAGNAIDGVAGSLGGMSNAAMGAAVGVGIVGIAVQKSVGEYLKLAGATREFRSITQASTEDSSRLVNILDDMGVSADAGAKAFGQLAKNVDSKKFTELGIEVAKTKDGATDLTGTFRNVITQLQGMHDPAQRTNVLVAAFGKSYQELLPLIEKGTASFDKMLKSNEGQLLHDKDLAAAEAWRAAMDEVGDAVKDIQITIGRNVLPYMIQLVKYAGTLGGYMEDAAHWAEKIVPGNAPGFLKFVQVMTTAVPGASLAIQKYSDDVKKTAEEAEKADKATRALGRSTEDTGDAAAAAAAQQQGLKDALDNRVKAALGLSGAQDRMNASMAALNFTEQENAARAKEAEALADKRATATEGVKRAEDALKDTRVRNAKDIAAAEKGVEDARQRIIDASSKVLSAEADLTRAKKDAASASADAARADNAYRLVLSGVGADAESARDALSNLNDAKAGVSSAEIEVRSAERRLATAKKQAGQATDASRIELRRQQIMLDLQDASQIVARAEKARNDVMARSTYFTSDLEQAERDIARARIEEATRTRDLNEELANLTDQTDEAAQAADDVQTAELAVIAARSALAAATADAAEKQRIYNGEVNGFPPGSKEAAKAEEERAKATDKVKAADDKVIGATGAVNKSKSDRAVATQGVTDKEKELADKIAETKKAEQDRLVELDTARTKLGLLRDVTKDAADKTDNYRGKIRDAIEAKADWIRKSAEAKGLVVSDADAIKLAYGQVYASVLKLGDPKAIAAAQQVGNTLAIAAGGVGAAMSGGGSGGGGSGAPTLGGSYATGKFSTSGSVSILGDQILAIAKSALGQDESGMNSIGAPGNLLAGRALAGEVNAWCQAYVTAVLKKAGAELPPGVASGTRAAIAAFQKAGAGIAVGQAGAGDLVYMRRQSDPKNPNKGHVGIVVSQSGDKITTLEGNTSGDNVAYRTRKASEWDLGAVDTAKLQQLKSAPNSTAAAKSVATGVTASMAQILTTIRTLETGSAAGDYTKRNSAGAAGAYQFIDSTWQAMAKKVPGASKYKQANLAPKAIQDAVAAAHVQGILDKNGGDVSVVPRVWYTGHNTKGKAEDNKVPRPDAGNVLTVAQYAGKWMGVLAKNGGLATLGTNAVNKLQDTGKKAALFQDNTAKNTAKQVTLSYASLDEEQKGNAILAALQDRGATAEEAQQRLANAQEETNGNIDRTLGRLGLTQADVTSFAQAAADAMADNSESTDNLNATLSGGAGSFGEAVDLFGVAVLAFGEAVQSLGGGGGGGGDEMPVVPPAPVVVAPVVVPPPPAGWSIDNRPSIYRPLEPGEIAPGVTRAAADAALGNRPSAFRPSLDDIPGYASGAYFRPVAGGHLGRIAEAGVPEILAPEPVLERIVRDNSSGVSIGQLVVQVPAGTDGRKFAEEMYDRLKELARSKGDVTNGAWAVGIR
jgi:hypothetical protein